MYSIQVYNGLDWAKVAVFSAEVPYDAIEEMARGLAVNPLVLQQNIAIIDDETGEVMWDDASANDDEPADIDDDCGFDPYEGYFTFDC